MGEYAKDPAAVTRQTASSSRFAAPLAVAAPTTGACGGRRGTMVALIAHRLVTRTLPPHL